MLIKNKEIDVMQFPMEIQEAIMEFAFISDNRKMLLEYLENYDNNYGTNYQREIVEIIG